MVLVFSHHSIRINNTISILPPTNVEDYGVLGFSSVGGRPYTRTYPSDTGFDQQSINKGYIDYGWIDEPTPTPSLFPYGSANFTGGMEQNVPVFIPFYSGTGTITISGSVQRESLLQAVQHLYSTLLVVQTRDLLLRHQKEQFYSISLVLEQREKQMHLLDLEILLSQEELELPLTQELSIIFLLLVFRHLLEVPLLHPVSIHQKELTYTYLVEHTQISRLDLLLNLPRRLCVYLENLLIQISITHLIMVSIETLVSKQVLPSCLVVAGGEYGDPGIVTTRFIPKYTGDTPILTFSGRSISRTNAPISTHGVIYILGIGTDGNGVIDDQTGIGDLSGVEFGAKERFVPATEIGSWFNLLRLYWYCTKQTNTELWLLRRRQRSRHIWSNYHSSGRWYFTIERVSSGFTEQMVLEHIFTVVLLKTKQQHSPKLVVDLYLQSVEYQKPRHLPNLLLEPPYSTERQMLPSLLRLQKIQQHLHYLEKHRLPSTSSMDLELLHSATISRLLLESETLSWYLVLSLDLVLQRSQQSYHLLQEQFLQISVVLQNTDQSKYSKTSFHLVHSHYLENSHIQISTSLQHTQVLELQLYLEQHYKSLLVRKLLLVLQHYLDLQFSDLQQTIWKEQSSSTPRCLCTYRTQSSLRILRRRQRSCTSGITTISGVGITKEIQVFGYYGDDRDPGTSGTFTFSNTPLVHPEVRYIPSIGIGVAVLYQTGGTALESFTFANYETQGRFKGLASVKESFGRATYVGIGQINTSGIAQEEYAVFEEPRTYVVII